MLPRIPLSRLPCRGLIKAQRRQQATRSVLSQQWRHTQSINTMASASQVKLSVEDTGSFKFQPQTRETADKTSELLQKNHEEHHIFFNADGFHNHIAHHLLTLYGLGAPASVIERHYKSNTSYQLRKRPFKESNVEDMSNPEHFKTYLGKGVRYPDFLEFFQKEIEAKGVGDVVREYLFEGDERADDMLARLFGGFLHPLIHLGFGLEFNQPAIVAEALAMCAVHDSYLGPFFLAAEKAAKSASHSSSKTLPQLLEEIRQDKELSTAAEWDDPNKIRDGIMKRASEKAIHYTSQWTVKEEELDQKTIEMINSALYYTAAAQHPPKQIKFDFYFMHCVNSSIFWAKFNSLPYLTTAQKTRLLEWKGRNDLIMYASRRSPSPLLDEIVQYTPKDLEAGGGEWKGLFSRLFAIDDDGHAAKLGRAIAAAEIVSRGWEKEDWCIIKGFMFNRIGNMVVDSVEDSGERWVRSAGFDRAWENYEDRPRSVHL